MASGARSYRSQLFMVRVWLEDLGADRTEWRGQVQHVASGQVRYFRDWPGLSVCVQEMLESRVRRSATTIDL